MELSNYNPTKYIRKKIQGKDYPVLEQNLRAIREARSPHEYVANSILYSIIVGIIVIPLIYATLSLFLDPELLRSISIPVINMPIELDFPIVFQNFIELEESTIFQILFIITSIIIGIIFGLLMYFTFILYPSIRASNREKGIEDMLPHATAYMLSLSKGGFEVIEIFESLSEQYEYGEISKEAGAISRNAKILGYSPTEAIEDVAETTPSEEFADFLTSFASVIETGSNMGDFLRRRSDELYESAKEKQQQNLEFLGIMSEVYVTSLGLGPIFAIIMLILFGMMGPFRTNILYIIVYIMIPFGTAVFIIVLDMQSRTEFGENAPKREESQTFQQLIRKYIEKSITNLRSLKKLTASPLYALIISLPAGALGVSLMFFLFNFRIETLITIFILISLTPVSIFYEMKIRRKVNMIEVAPDFLHSLSDFLRSGISPYKAFSILEPEKYEILGEEIENIRKDVEWGHSVTEAFERSADRLETKLISRVMSLLHKTSEVASDTSEIIEVLARDVETERKLQIERKNVTTTYAIIVFLTFGIFLLTSYNIASSLVPLMTRMSEAQGAQGGQGFSQIGGISPNLLKQVFFRASLMQGFFSGILAGMMKTGSPYSGLKFSMIMLSIAWSFFTIMGF